VSIRDDNRIIETVYAGIRKAAMRASRVKIGRRIVGDLNLPLWGRWIAEGETDEVSAAADSACATMRVPRVKQTKTPPEETIKKRPDISDRFVLADKTNCAGGVYRVSFSSLDARRSGGSQAPLGPDSLPPILAL